MTEKCRNRGRVDMARGLISDSNSLREGQKAHNSGRHALSCGTSQKQDITACGFKRSVTYVLWNTMRENIVTPVLSNAQMHTAGVWYNLSPTGVERW